MNCKNCNTKISTGLFNSNISFKQEIVDIINFYQVDKKEGYCEKCGKELKKISLGKLKDEKINIEKTINENISSIPLASINSPLGWDYETIGIVTAQSTTGTGFLSDATSDFSDFFGTQSHSHNAKIKNGENLCMKNMRQQTLKMGGNAIIGVDIDYSEVGGAKAMLMVCTTGTVVKIKNIEILTNNLKSLKKLDEVKKRMLDISLLNK